MTMEKTVSRGTGHRDDASALRAAKTRLRWLISLEGFVAVTGFGGGAYMTTHPLSVMSLQFLRGTWFHTWRWPGLALMFFIGICPAMVVAAALRQRKEADLGHLCVGVGLIAWVTLEAAWIVTSAGLQIAFGLIGFGIAWRGWRNLADGRRGRHDSRDEFR